MTDENTGRHVFFDVDGTLLPWDSQYMFACFVLQRHGWRRLFLLFYVCCLPLYLLRIWDETRMKRAFLCYLWRLSAETVRQYGKEFAVILERVLYPQMKECLQRHVERGDRCVLVSASPAVYIQPLAELTGAECALGTEIDMGDVMPLMPVLPFGNNKGEVKVQRLRAYGLMPPEGMCPDSVAYSDSAADLPLLTACERQVLVNPSERFKNNPALERAVCVYPLRAWRTKLGKLWQITRFVCGVVNWRKLVPAVMMMLLCCCTVRGEEGITIPMSAQPAPERIVSGTVKAGYASGYDFHGLLVAGDNPIASVRLDWRSDLNDKLSVIAMVQRSFFLRSQGLDLAHETKLDCGWQYLLDTGTHMALSARVNHGGLAGLAAKYADGSGRQCTSELALIMRHELSLLPAFYAQGSMAYSWYGLTGWWFDACLGSDFRVSEALWMQFRFGTAWSASYWRGGQGGAQAMFVRLQADYGVFKHVFLEPFIGYYWQGGGTHALNDQYKHRIFKGNSWVCGVSLVYMF